jgi:hypothetical protein
MVDPSTDLTDVCIVGGKKPAIRGKESNETKAILNIAILF